MASNRTVVATLALDGVEGVEKGFSRAGQAALKFGKTTQEAGGGALGWIEKHEGQLNRAAGGMLKLGAVGVAALGGMTWAAVDWETAWAGVTKTVDGTPQQLAAIEQGLRDMTKELPASHAELAAVAEAAGQLGVETDSVLGFTRTMVNLGETTNLSASEAAIALARLMNIMGTSQSNADRLGSTIVELGNNFATTEAEIVNTSQRMAAIGAQMGMSEADVLGISTVLSSLGIEAELAGSSMQRSMMKIDAAVREGGSNLRLLAQTSGMSAEQFSSAWRDDAAGTLASFVEGLGGLIGSGQDANAVLNELGITSVGEIRAMTGMAGATEAAGQAHNMLRDALAMSGQAWNDNTALAAEAEKRYQTSAAKFQMAINGIKDEMISLGEVLLPIVSDALAGLVDLTEGFSQMSDPAKSAVLGILGISTIALLAGGSVIKLVTAVASLKTGLATLGISARTATLAMGAIGLVLTVAGVALGGWMQGQAEARAHVDALTEAIRTQDGVLGESSRSIMSNALEADGVLAMAEKLGLNLAMVTDAALGSQSAIAEMNSELSKGIAAIDERIAAHKAEQAVIDEKMKTGSETDAEAERWRELQAEIDAANAKRGEWIAGQASLESVTNRQNEATNSAAAKARRLEEANAANASATNASAEASKKDADAKAAQAAAAQLTAEEMKSLLDATQAFANQMLRMSGSQMGVEAAIDDLNDSITEYRDNLIKQQVESGKSKDAAAAFADRAIANGHALDINTEAGRKNQKALDSLAASTMELVKTHWEQGSSAEEIRQATARGREEWVKAATAMGRTREEALRLADAYFAIPEVRATETTAPGADAAQRQVRELREEIEGLPPEKRSVVKALLDAGNVEAALAQLARERSVILRVRTAGGTSAPVMGRTVASAHGNLFEDHSPHIAPAGSWRLFGEPETGGEAYIPLANDHRRPRAESILLEVARRFGMSQFAYGAITTGSSSVVTNNRRSTTVQATFVLPGLTAAQAVEEFAAAWPAVIAQGDVQ